MAIYLVGRDINGPIGDWDVGHLMLIRDFNGTTFDSDDQVIRGGPSQSQQIEIQNQMAFLESDDNPANWIPIGNFSTFHEPAEISFSDPNYEAVAWNIMNQIADQIHANAIEYIRAYQNSNSVIGSLLSIFGIQDSDFGLFGYDGIYPGFSHGLDYDGVNEINYSYTITGGNNYISSNPESDPVGIDDNLFAFTGFPTGSSQLEGDHLFGFAGDDTLHDGLRQDFLEGGEGDDTFVLLEDGAADIIVVGSGNDIIQGGDADDRIVIRLDGIAPSLVEGGDGITVGAGLGELAAGLAIPLLGGFSYADGSNFWVYTPTTTSVLLNSPPNVGGTSEEHTHDELSYLHYDGGSAWTAFASYNTSTSSDGSNFSTTPFEFGYELIGSDLIVSGMYATEENDEIQWHDFTVTIQDYENGDFGIMLYDSLPVFIRYWDSYGEGGIYTDDEMSFITYENVDGVNYINNNGNYINVVSAPDPVDYSFA